MANKVQQLKRVSAVREALLNGNARQLRLGAGLSIAELSLASGVAESTIWRYENGQRVPRAEQALRLEVVYRALARRAEL